MEKWSDSPTWSVTEQALNEQGPKMWSISSPSLASGTARATPYAPRLPYVLAAHSTQSSFPPCPGSPPRIGYAPQHSA